MNTKKKRFRRGLSALFGDEKSENKKKKNLHLILKALIGDLSQKNISQEFILMKKNLRIS